MSTLKEDLEVLRNVAADCRVYIDEQPAIARFVRIGEALAGLSEEQVAYLGEHHEQLFEYDTDEAENCVTVWSTPGLIQPRETAEAHRALAALLEEVRR